MRRRSNASRLIGLLSVYVLTISFVVEVVPAQESGWPQFRGPKANPISDNDALPARWSKTENVEWKTEVPGRGWSSPIVANNKVFLTSATTDGESKLPQTGTEYSNEYVAELMKQGLSEEEVEKKVLERDFELPSEVSLHYFVHCLDLETGKELWKDEFHSGQPPGGRHRKNSFCSETPITDGELVYIYSTNLGLFAYDLDGKQVWKTKLDAFPIYFEFGTGASPILVEDKVVILNDNEESSFIAAFDKKTGHQVWKTDREPVAGLPPKSPKSGWMTPFAWEHEDRTEIVTVAPGVAISYDVEGNELWRMKGVTIAPAASSFAYDDILMLDGGRGRPMFAIRSGASGDITPDDGKKNENAQATDMDKSDDQAASNEATATRQDMIVWTRPRAGTYIPTPVAYQGGLYILQDVGIVSRLNTQTGEQSFKERLKTSGADFTTSPWAYNGMVFCLSEQGDTYVLKAGEEYSLLHVNSLGELAMASPAIVGDRLLIRTEKALYSIRNTGK